MIKTIPLNPGMSRIGEVQKILQARASKDVSLAVRRAAFDKIGKSLAGIECSTCKFLDIHGVKVSVTSCEEHGHNYILYFHGGAYCLGSHQSYAHLLSRLSEITKHKVYFISYRLAPEYKYPTAIDDCYHVYEGMIESGIPSSSINFVGDSAGAALALNVCVKAREKGIGLPKSISCISPWVDLTLLNSSIKERSLRDYFLSPQTLHWCAEQYLGEINRDDPGVSPVFADLSGLPPILIQVGSEEILFDDAYTLMEVAEKHGVSVSLEMWEGMCHIWPFFYSILDEGNEALHNIAKFLH